MVQLERIYCTNTLYFFSMTR